MKLSSLPKPAHYALKFLLVAVLSPFMLMLWLNGELVCRAWDAWERNQ